MKFEKICSIAVPLSDDKQKLYMQGTFSGLNGEITINRGEFIDLGTYFNLFSIKKWLEYTTIKKLKIQLDLAGKYNAEFYGMSVKGEKSLTSVIGANVVEMTFDIDEIKDFDCLGVRIEALSDDVKFRSGEYLGLFDSDRDVRMGITICTFKRERYLLPNLERLKELINRNPNINIMVIDNGQTLEEVKKESLQIIHNRNFGGSGGFARGMIEQVSQNEDTHIILMDDDIVIELSAFDKLYALLRHLKTEYQDKFVGGAMIKLDDPTIQHENTAHWNRVLTQAFGNNFDLTDKKILCKNEYVPQHVNQYAAWWFCCIPLESVKKLGYPLPIFVRGDDVEYGLRNGKEILTMNGIGVWHETFAKKLNTTIAYFNDRNMLLINHFAEGCGRLTFLAAIMCRIAKRILTFRFKSLIMLELALKDLNTGLNGITSVASDKKFESIKDYPLDKNILLAICSIIKLGIAHCMDYDKLDDEYKKFRNEKLKTQTFWRSYLNIK